MFFYKLLLKKKSHAFKKYLVMHIMEGVFCMYNFTIIKGYFSSCQSLLCRMTILNSNVLKRKKLKTTKCVFRHELTHLRLVSFFKFYRIPSYVFI